MANRAFGSMGQKGVCMATDKKKKQPRRSMKDGPWSRVSQEINQGWELRKGFIEKIERKIEAKVIVYFTSFGDEAAMITDEDAEMIENVLSAEHDGGKVVLILNSLGGLALAAERIVNVCRAYSGNQFEVIVPHMAKSAATLICFGCSCIWMSPTAELGPVDPQIKYVDDSGEKQWISAEEYVTSYEKLVEDATSGKAKRIEALVQQLARYDARHIEKLRSAQFLSGKISIKLLKNGMMSRCSEATIEKRIKSFLIHEHTASHGRMITMAEAKKCGLRIKEIELRSDLWEWIWELYVRGNFRVSRARKLIESNTTSLSA